MGRAAPNVDDQDPEPLTSGAASLLLPGVGQLLNKDFVKAIAFALIALYMWGFQLGWVIHILAAFEASHSASVIAEKRIMLRDCHWRGAKRSK